MYAQLIKSDRFKNENVIDIRADKKLGLLLYAAAIALAGLLTAIGNLFVPIYKLYDANGISQLVLRFALLIVGIVLCLWANENIRACYEKRATGKKPRIRCKGLSMYPQSVCYFSLETYVKYSFLPVAIIGAVLLLLILILPERFFWQIYIMLIINICGAIGDLYAVLKIRKVKGELVIKDNGTSISYWT